MHNYNNQMSRQVKNPKNTPPDFPKVKNSKKKHPTKCHRTPKSLFFKSENSKKEKKNQFTHYF